MGCPQSKQHGGLWRGGLILKWYKSPHPGMNSTGMQPALLITLPANQQRLLSETLINQERLMQNENTPFDPLWPFLLLRSQFHIILTPSYCVPSKSWQVLVSVTASTTSFNNSPITTRDSSRWLIPYTPSLSGILRGAIATLCFGSELINHPTSSIFQTCLGLVTDEEIDS